MELSEEFTLSSMNDLSEDKQREMDDIYIALAEMAHMKKDLEKPNRIGFVKD